jgi:hypothetical protein
VTYISTARNLILKIKQGQEDETLNKGNTELFYNEDQDMKLLRDMDNHYLYDPLKRSSELYEEDYQDHVAGMKVWHKLLMSLYVVFSLALFFFVYAPMINKLGLDSKNAWNLCKLIPQDQSEKCKKLVLIIKERRDNFKWR